MIHPTAEIEADTVIGSGTDIWARTHVRHGARVADVYIGAGVRLGSRCKVQNKALLFEGTILENDVFIGPLACLTNDLYPRASVGGELKQDDDWHIDGITVREGASIGAAAVVLPGVTVGRRALVGAGSVVVRDVSDHGLVAGNPARPIGWVCRCGRTLVDLLCTVCGTTHRETLAGLEESV
jgi:UDP-2-acetamido-3-amino-2,3-dideoxy-glucuronate N-acetyltransferase